MKSKKIIILIACFILIIFSSFYFDSGIVKAVSTIRGEFLNELFFGLTFVSSEIIIFFFLTSLFLWREHKRKWIFPLWFTLALSAVMSFFLKFLIQRQRPFQLGIVSVPQILEKASYFTWNFSFPSFQAMLVFCAVPILSKEFRKFKYFWVIFAGLIAFSRVYFGLHFLSDVLAGGLIGYLLGWFVIKLEIDYKFGEKIYRGVFRK